MSTNIETDEDIIASILTSKSFMMNGGKKTTYICNYCHRDVTLSLRFRCNACKDFDLCQDCFSVGVNIYPHTNLHSYKVVDCLDNPIFTKDWSIGEELLLLEGDKKI